MRSSGGNQHFDLAILGLLSEESQHGYELHRRILASFSILFQPSWGSLYPALARLERSGFIETAVPSAPRVPIATTGSLSGDLALFRSMAASPSSRRQRKVYSINPLGANYLTELLDRIDVADDRSFWIGLAFSGVLERPRQGALINKRKYLLEDRLREVKESRIFGESGSRAVALQGLTERISAEISWLDSVAKSLVESADSSLGGFHQVADER